MKFSHFFIKRPIFAGVLSLLILIIGAISLLRLPISEYPEVVPPTVVVRAVYPGANPKTIAETVASPLEQQINGIENSLYMFSQSTSDGVMTLTITFKLGTDVDNAQVQVQNRVSQALPKLPEDVRRIGVTTFKSSPDLTMVVHLFSPNGRYDDVYLRNYASLQVKDELARIQGIGQIQVFGSGDYSMRVWLDPNKVAARDMSAGEIIAAIREQNMQVAAGSIGQQPTASAVPFELNINTRGRLITEEEFENIVVKTGANGETTLLKDVARIELGAAEYVLRSQLNNKSAVAIPISQLPGSNALQLSEDVRKRMAELKKKFPEGIDYSVVYDPTVFVRDSIKAVVKTLFEAIILVVIVVLVFLQTWRASIIPLAAVPVSLIGTFAVMQSFGFTINALSLFGLVLAIGIVVDDAIVVVENVERNIALGLSPLDATRKAMDEVSGPIIATALVLCAVFIPTAFISGLSGQFYKQFAITIAISTVISAFNSLTLSPALSAALLKPHGAKPDKLSVILEKLFGWFFRPFNRFFDWSSRKYSRSVAAMIRKSAVALLLYAGLVILTGWSFVKTPTGFIPSQDKQYLIAFAQLPDASSLDRTDSVVKRMADIALKHPGVSDAIAFPGLSINGFTVSPNSGIIFVGLKPFDQRKSSDLSGNGIAGALNQQFSSIQDAFIAVFPPPPIMGLGQIGGFKLQIQDRAGLGAEELYKVTMDIMAKANQTKGLAGVFSSFQVNVPQIDADVNRQKAKSLGVPLGNVFETMQVYLGSLYVNDFNRFGRTYQVIAQADAEFRQRPEDITRLKTRNSRGEMVPLGSIVKVTEGYGPDRIMHYNGYASAELNGSPAPGYSSGQSEEILEKLVRESLPPGFEYEWTDLTYQKILAGNTAYVVFPLCLLLVFLVLAAQYESLRLPLAIVLIVPMCLLFAIAGVWITRGDNNIFTQIGLIVLVGLACKNAILIVEFAKVRQDEGLSAMDAALEACRLRLRPILMTSIAFIAGVFPLVTSTGAGAEMRQAMGVAVFSGMIGVTFFGLFLTPIFYVVLMKRAAHQPSVQNKPASGSVGSHGLATGAAMIALLLASSTQAAVGPDYVRPKNETSLQYKSGQLGNWKEAKPLDNVPRGAWWAIFEDATLNDLQKQAQASNQNLKAAFARVEQARAVARVARSEFLPSLDLNASATRLRTSPRQRVPAEAFGYTTTGNAFSVPLDLSYEIDLWGRVRRSFEAARAETGASLAAFHSFLLTLHGDLAQNYFALRAFDAEVAIVARTIELRKEELQLVQGRFQGGIGNELDIARAETELYTAEAESAALLRRRAEFENAIAILTGTNPADFKLASLELKQDNFWDQQPPLVPAGMPADLLERRPDVAEAERQLAAANARIGMAKAAFFPVVRLTASGGFLSGDIESLFNWDSRVWSVGPSVSLPIFAGGRNRANLRRSRAAFEEAVAGYRQRILVAFGEVENALSGIQFLASQSMAQDRAVTSARRGAELASERYKAGLVSYLEVVDANRLALLTQRAKAQLAGERLIATVQLIRALGGGWQEQLNSSVPVATASLIKY